MLLLNLRTIDARTLEEEVSVHLARSPVLPVRVLEPGNTVTNIVIMVMLLDGALGATVTARHHFPSLITYQAPVPASVVVPASVAVVDRCGASVEAG